MTDSKTPRSSGARKIIGGTRFITILYCAITAGVAIPQTVPPAQEEAEPVVTQDIIKGTPVSGDRESVQPELPDTAPPKAPPRLPGRAPVLVNTGANTAASTSTHAVGEPLSVIEGQTVVLPFPDAKRVIAGNGEIVDVKAFEDTGEVVVFARKQGMTDLRMWSRDGRSESHIVRVYALEQALETETTILLQARFLEVKRDVLQDVGVDWADVATGPIFGTVQELVSNKYFRVIPDGVSETFENVLPGLDVGSGNNYFSLTTTIDSVIRLLVSNGDARLLAEPTLTCINGGKADFLAGGELPIPIVDNDGRVNVQFKEFGIILNIEPLANDAGLIRTKVNVEVSSVDESISVDGVPGFATRKTKTEMNVQSGQTMVVGGLFSTDDSKTVAKVPGFGNIPILGELFKSRNFRSGQTELVVLVSPRIIVSESKEVRAAQQQYDELKTRSDELMKFKLKD